VYTGGMKRRLRGKRLQSVSGAAVPQSSRVPNGTRRYLYLKIRCDSEMRIASRGWIRMENSHLRVMHARDVLQGL
jgi:hypothetical protein